jgi:dinuclear metal center YbgI/SA1388 family protein
MANRKAITDFTDKLLDSKSIKDRSRNGLQVEGAENVGKIVFGVSASLKLIKAAAELEADMIIVHHGLFWDRSERVAGPLREKLELLLRKNISLCAWHLPLDKHPSVGNNAGLLAILGAKNLKPFGTYEGETIGYRGVLPGGGSAAGIAAALSRALASIPAWTAGPRTPRAAGRSVTCYDFGPENIRTVGVVSGGAQGMFSQAIEAGLDLYITGEVSEYIQEMARENKTAFIAGGHYNTEKPGVYALQKLLRSKFKVETVFVDIPNQA